MENARTSKSLIGTIFILLAVIGLGFLVFNFGGAILAFAGNLLGLIISILVLIIIIIIIFKIISKIIKK